MQNELESGADLPTHKTCFKCSVCSVRLNLKTYKRLGAILYCQQHVPQQNFVEKGTAIKPPSAPTTTSATTTSAPTLVKTSSGTNVRAPSPGPTAVVKPTTPTTTPAVAAKTTTTTTPAPTVKATTPAPAPSPVSNTKTTTPAVKSEPKPVPKVEPKPEPKPEPVAEPEPEVFAPPPPPPVLPAGFFDDVDAKTLKRLEDLTARLESKAGGAASGSNKKETLDAAVARLSAIVSRIEAVGARGPVSGGSSGGSSSSAATVTEFTVYVDDVVKPFLALSDKIGDDVQKLGVLILVVVNTHKDLLEKASKSKKPSQADLQNLLGPLSGAINEVSNFREKK